MFNVAFHACLNNPAPTCGALRSQAAAGWQVVTGLGSPSGGSQFSSGQSTSLWSMPATAYNLLYVKWGLLTRPSNFDQLVAERYGTPLAAERNPYPLPGEDPNLTNGGSGQLPAAFSQLRNPDGSWSGNIGLTCAVCHGGQIGNASD